MLKNTKTGETETVVFQESDLLGPDESTIPENDIDILNMLLYLKDRYNISGTDTFKLKLCVSHYSLCTHVNLPLYKLINVYVNVCIGNAYHEMAQLFKSMPRHYKLKNRIAELNTMWNIGLTPSGTVGVQQKLEERLQFCLQNLVRLPTTQT